MVPADPPRYQLVSTIAALEQTAFNTSMVAPVSGSICKTARRQLAAQFRSSCRFYHSDLLVEPAVKSRVQIEGLLGARSEDTGAPHAVRGRTDEKFAVRPALAARVAPPPPAPGRYSHAPRPCAYCTRSRRTTRRSPSNELEISQARTLHGHTHGTRACSGLSGVTATLRSPRAEPGPHSGACRVPTEHA